MVDRRTENDNKILAALALALVNRPTATLQELAKAIGISKATLYRFCHTREQLVARLMNHGADLLLQAVQTAELDTTPPVEALKRLIANHMAHRELAAFLMYYWRPDTMLEPCADAEWHAALDAFFLRGQQNGAFRIDIPAPALSEIFGSIIMALVDAEHRGRVARSGLAALAERAFLHGAAAE
jgi:TetR/AcrR family transcriptional repressor of mexCD-oprJ operon